MIHKLTREEALKYHRQMWSDMRDALGDDPTQLERERFKREWCKAHFPEEIIECDCFLCEYDLQKEGEPGDSSPYCGETCLIDWSGQSDYSHTCTSGTITYDKSPISVILALPERKEEGK